MTELLRYVSEQFARMRLHGKRERFLNNQIPTWKEPLNNAREQNMRLSKAKRASCEAL